MSGVYFSLFSSFSLFYFFFLRCICLRDYYQIYYLLSFYSIEVRFLLFFVQIGSCSTWNARNLQKYCVKKIGTLGGTPNMTPRRKENVNQKIGESLASQDGTQVPQLEQPIIQPHNEETDSSYA